MNRTNSPALGPESTAASEHRSGLIAAIGAFLIWGLIPAYLKAIQVVPAEQVLAHRIVWCAVFVLAWLAVRRELSALGAAFANGAVLLRLAATSVLISINWLVYIWAINHGHVIDASLGYFINPLVSVLLGVVVLHERLNRSQNRAVAIAAAGVGYLAIVVGRLPWIALALAVSFGLYGLLRKVVAVEAVPGLAVETLLLTPLAGGYLAWCQTNGTSAFGQLDFTVDVMLIGSGLVTALPLALFSFGARRIPLSTIGLIQYIGPSLQLLLGITMFGEPFPAVRALGFGMIWLALAVYIVDGALRPRPNLGD